MTRREFELIFGLIFFLISIIYGFYKIKDWRKIQKDDYMLKSFSIKTIGGLVVFFIIGVVGIYRYFF